MKILIVPLLLQRQPPVTKSIQFVWCQIAMMFQILVADRLQILYLQHHVGNEIFSCRIWNSFFMDERAFLNVETPVPRLETEVSNYGNTKKLMALIFLVSKNNFPNRIDISAKNSHVSILNDAKREYPCNLFLIVCRLPPTSFYCEACQRKYD